jgi:hypothetical protein
MYHTGGTGALYGDSALDNGYTTCYTQIMKTAISIDEMVYENAEETAGEMGLSRSRLYTLALEEYLQNHKGDAVMERLNRYYTDHKAVLDDDVKQAAYALFSQEDW